MNASELKSRLRARHPANRDPMPGPWTVIEEFRGIDLLAIGAWHSVKHARVGYEVKTSRADLRRELLRPYKREHNVEWCNEFYFACPAGLLTDEELAFTEPPEFQQAEAFSRERCPAGCMRDRQERENGRWERYDLQPGDEEYLEGRGWENRRTRWITCVTCGGAGHLELSLVEREAPTLWVPADVGLILVDGRGTKVVRRSPRRKEVEPLSPGELGQLARFISMRPDPRHHPQPAEVAHIRAEAAA